MLYFGYGSNMDPEQMKIRCPNTEVVGIGFIPGHTLCFPRLSVNRDCGVSSIEPAAGQNAWGVVYRLTTADAANLDKSEGFRADRPQSANSYNRVPVLVTMNGVPTEMQTYIAKPQTDVPYG